MATASCQTVSSSATCWADWATGSNVSSCLSFDMERPGCTIPIVQSTFGVLHPADERSWLRLRNDPEVDGGTVVLVYFAADPPPGQALGAQRL